MVMCIILNMAFLLESVLNFHLNMMWNVKDIAFNYCVCTSCGNLKRNTITVIVELTISTVYVPFHDMITPAS